MKYPLPLSCAVVLLACNGGSERGATNHDNAMGGAGGASCDPDCYFVDDDHPGPLGDPLGDWDATCASGVLPSGFVASPAEAMGGQGGGNSECSATCNRPTARHRIDIPLFAQPLGIESFFESETEVEGTMQLELFDDDLDPCTPVAKAELPFRTPGDGSARSACVELPVIPESDALDGFNGWLAVTYDASASADEVRAEGWVWYGGGCPTWYSVGDSSE